MCLASFPSTPYLTTSALRLADNFDINSIYSIPGTNQQYHFGSVSESKEEPKCLNTISRDIMPPKPPTPIPPFYRISFLILDPLIAIWGALMNIFTPSIAVDAFVPASISPYQPLQSFLLHQISGGLLTCAILDVFLLRKTNEVWIWRTQQWAQLAYDVVILGSQVHSWGQQGRLSLGKLRVEDYGSFGIVVVVGVVRCLFIAGVGMRRKVSKRH